ncbi:glutathione S-transferase N-terminal domain-containing protein [Shewanella sp. D64]|uniref:glutathione S-transferase n=1 Tax=unclassified Shewanella TaxID=196818 RepID=UPI0022BA23B7|nr:MULTISPECIES: glutathione S-transferase N-terminal domain-containing protein [unclassified Shewanella]MEC4727252.1 glutathione S-transferase N-terminal domain-containing protein [Shewanella sp. D64]MEC4739407.1 glutathione S-transferase N-terminal domain-containing protein [Shewanella sp. E94]WBJ96736.1 glutathione S-transferase N-terminal domain-containing protein [Shewanella sp. MTB7]
MKLLYSDASPYSRCVRVLIRHLELDGIEECIVNPMDNSETLLEINPLGKIPCLQLNDGSPLYDSEVILRYLDHEFGASRLFGENGYNWKNECQLSLINGLLDSAVALRQEQMRELEGKRSLFWTARFEQALLRGLKEVEQSGVMVSPQLTIQQIGLACLLEYLDFRHSDLQWRKVVPAIGAWLSGFEHLSMMTSTRPI